MNTIWHSPQAIKFQQFKRSLNIFRFNKNLSQLFLVSNGMRAVMWSINSVTLIFFFYHIDMNHPNVHAYVCAITKHQVGSFLHWSVATYLCESTGVVARLGRESSSSKKNQSMQTVRSVNRCWEVAINDLEVGMHYQTWLGMNSIKKVQ